MELVISNARGFAKKNAVMLIAFAAALITSLFVPVDKEYIGYFDFKTLSCLFCVLAVVCAAVSGILFAVIPFDKGLLLALMLQYTLPAPFIIPLYADLGDDAEYVSTTLSLGTVLAVLLFFLLTAFSLA